MVAAEQAWRKQRGGARHAGVWEALPNELARAEREGASLVIAMIDLDHFRAFNDTYGHPAGDKFVEARLGSHPRPSGPAVVRGYPDNLRR